jgi:hypothetical protein
VANDDGDWGDEPIGDIGGSSTSSGSTWSGGVSGGDLFSVAGPPVTRDECIAAGKGGTEAREDFCRRIPRDKARGCWSRVYSSLVEWIGWCSWTF